MADLRTLRSEVEAGVATVPLDTATGETPRGWPRWLTAAAVVLALLAGGLLGRGTAPTAITDNGGVVRFDIRPAGSFQSVYNRVAAISRDGMVIVFAAGEGLWLRRTDRAEGWPLPGTEEGREPFFSPDGHQVGFWGQGRMRWAAVANRADDDVVVGPPVPRPVGATWGNDGMVYVGQGDGGILRVDPRSADTETVMTVEPGELAHGPELLPGGEWLVFAIADGVSAWDESRIVAQSLRTGERRELIGGGREPRYLPPGYLLFVRDGVLHAARFDSEALEIRGTAQRIVSDIAVSNRDYTGAANYDISDTGTLIYQPLGATLQYQAQWLDGDAIEPLPFERRAFASPSLSPDGQRVALEVVRLGEGTSIWVYGVERDAGTRLVEGGENRSPRWSPDGEWIYYSSDRQGSFDVWRQRADLSGEAELVYEAPGDQVPAGISPDGEWLLFTQMRPNNSDILRVRLDGEGEPEEVASTEDDEPDASFSADGRFVAYARHETDGWKVYAVEIETGRRWVVGPAGYLPRWSADGSRIVYRTPVGITAIDVRWDNDLVRSPPATVPMRREGEYSMEFDVSADGQRVLALSGAGRMGAAETLRVVVNWIEELRQSLPDR